MPHSIYHFVSRTYPGGATSRLWLLEPERDWRVTRFCGKAEPCCEIVKALFRPARWPQTLYWLRLSPGVVPVQLLCEPCPPWVLDYRTWAELAADMCCPVAAARHIMADMPDAYQYLE